MLGSCGRLSSGSLERMTTTFSFLSFCLISLHVPGDRVGVGEHWPAEQRQPGEDDDDLFRFLILLNSSMFQEIESVLGSTGRLSSASLERMTTTFSLVSFCLIPPCSRR